MGSLVKGVIIHESLLIQDHATTSFHPPAHSLLRKLRHSNLHIGIYCSPYLLDNKVFPITLSWGDIGGEILYLISNSKKDAIGQLSNLGWIIVVFDVEGAGACENSGVVCISKLEEFPLVICGLNRKRLAIGDKAVTVGYFMKPSREEDFSKRGAFPMNPAPNGLMFLPLTFELPLPAQLQLVDLVLVISVDLSGSSESTNRITFSPGMLELQRCCLGVFHLQPEFKYVADAYRMAIIFRVEDFKDLNIPLPAIVQEYVDHSSNIFKNYVLGELLFCAVKKSIPDVNVLTKSSERNELGPLFFDSLKSLPIGTEHYTDANSFKTNIHSFDLELVTDAVNWLARKLDLTIFGFDAVASNVFLSTYLLQSPSFTGQRPD
ncbi:hypothetical protein POTOM_027743 [Populus tomentosa]|uniref:inositol-1,3,4-trisphosphate 5/6-kinase n=1 Tax=Populus tomentosa TaxID=118781 RepID=A0A8X8CXG9_POPTO|nr:hypothetical protein POTOM_027743 [Populus tomentosa]